MTTFASRDRSGIYLFSQIWTDQNKSITEPSAVKVSLDMLNMYLTSNLTMKLNGTQNVQFCEELFCQAYQHLFDIFIFEKYV